MTGLIAFLPNIGVPELLIILGILILILGPKQIPKAAKSLGKGLRGFRESVDGKDEEAEIPEKVDATAGDGSPITADAPASETATTTKADREA